MGQKSRMKWERRVQADSVSHFWIIPFQDFLPIIVRESKEIAAKACYELNRDRLAISFALHQYPYFWEVSESDPTNPVLLWELTPPNNSLQPYVLRSTPWADALRRGCVC